MIDLELLKSIYDGETQSVNSEPALSACEILELQGMIKCTRSNQVSAGKAEIVMIEVLPIGTNLLWERELLTPPEMDEWIASLDLLDRRNFEEVPSRMIDYLLRLRVVSEPRYRGVIGGKRLVGIHLTDIGKQILDKQ